MGGKSWVAVLAAVGASWILGCSSSEVGYDPATGGHAGGGALCTPGETRTCVGPAACEGGQMCERDGYWGACDCGGIGPSGIHAAPASAPAR